MHNLINEEINIRMRPTRPIAYLMEEFSEYLAQHNNEESFDQKEIFTNIPLSNLEPHNYFEEINLSFSLTYN